MDGEKIKSSGQECPLHTASCYTNSLHRKGSRHHGCGEYNRPHGIFEALIAGSRDSRVFISTVLLVS